MDTNKNYKKNRKDVVYVNYVKIPREIVCDVEMEKERVIIYAYLCARRALDDTVAFSVPELVQWTGLKPNSHRGKINHKYLDTLQSFAERGYFTDFPDFEELKSAKRSLHTYYKVKLNIDLFDNPDWFGMIYFDELQRIIHFKETLKEIYGDINDLSRMSASYIMLVLSYIRSNICRLPDKPQSCYRNYNTIAADIGLSERYIAKIVELLDVMGIVKYQEIGRYRYKTSDGNYVFITSPKVFADCRRFKKDQHNNMVLDSEYDYQEEIAKQIAVLTRNQK